jgi:DNA-binding NarL/FixJ family response regulator
VYKTSTAPIRLLLVDDHHLFREGLVRALSGEREFEVVCQASNGEVALDLWRQHRPDVTLMDVVMPRMDGVEATRRLLAEHPQARVLMLTSSEELLDARLSLETGAVGFIVKTVAFDELLVAIRTANAGGRAVSPTLAHRLAVCRPGHELTAREIEVLRGLRDGMSLQEIGKHLRVAERTVRADVATIKETLGAATIGQVIARAFERGILSSTRLDSVRK